MSEVRDQDQASDLMSASMTQTKTPEGGHSGPPKSGSEKPAVVTSKSNLNAFGSSPEDWTEKSLGDILTLNYGWSLPEKKRVPGDAPVYGSNGIVGTHQQALVTSPGLIIGRKGSAGNVHYSRKPFCPIDTTFYIAPSDTPLDIEFLYFLLLHIDLKRILGDVGVPGLNREMAYKEKTRFPTGADEQRRIAGVLGLVQRAIEQQERLIALTAELKKMLLHQLFTQGLRGEPQKQTDIGPVPESWEAATLGELACKPDGSLQTGPFGSQLHKHDYLSEGVGVVNPTHLWNNQINHEDVPRVSPETATRLERHRLEVGDILFARRGEIGRHGMVTEKEEGWLCGTGCFLARVRRKDIDNRFLSYLFSTSGCIAWLNSHAAGAIMPNLNNTVLRSMPVFFPKLEIQTEIANCLDATKQKMAIHQRKHAALTALFRTLLHQLMTAQLRVHGLELPNLESNQ
jgi:type I restriction enzyme S subunit